MGPTRRKSVVWIIGMIFSLYAILIATITFPGLGIPLILLVMVLFIAFVVKLLYSKKSSLWNGGVAFLFWLPLLGLHILKPGTEAVAKGKVVDEAIGILVIAMAHGLIQCAGRAFINRFHPQETTRSSEERIISRVKQFLLMMCAFPVIHTPFILQFTTRNLSEEMELILPVSAMICFVVVFFSLLYVEKSLLWNGIVAFLFWMPVVGWWRLIPEMREVPFYDVLYVVFQIGLVHACIQVLGRIVMNLFIWRGTAHITKTGQA